MAEPVRILHLTDLHLGAGELRDEDMKITVEGAERARVVDRLGAYLRALGTRPDFVCATGDFTNAGRPDGFTMFREWIEPLIEDGVLPPADRILITPGNHDVARRPEAPKEMFKGFFELARAFPHAHLPHLDPPLPGTPTFDSGASQAGGMRTETRMGRVEITSSEPYLLDRDRGVLLFAFNSSLACGVFPDESRALLERIAAAQAMADGDQAMARRLDGLRKEAEASLLIDAGMVGEGQIEYFEKLMDRLRTDLGELEWARTTKIGLLHHHVNPIWRQQLELKPFESIIDSAQVKQALTEFGFDMVLHGHKHQNGVALDAKVLPRASMKSLNPICVVSGGTVCGNPALNDTQTFKMLVLEPGPNRQTAILEEYPLRAAADPKRSMSEERIVYQLPLADRIPDLHDDTALKEAIDRLLLNDAIAHCATPYDSRADDVEMQWPGDGGLVSEESRYRFQSVVERSAERAFFEVLIATERLDFRQRARIHWMLVEVDRQAKPAGPRPQVVLVIADMSATHFSRELEAGEIGQSIEKLKRSFAPAIDRGLLHVVVREMSQDETERADSKIGAGDRYES